MILNAGILARRLIEPLIRSSVETLAQRNAIPWTPGHFSLLRMASESDPATDVTLRQVHGPICCLCSFIFLSHNEREVKTAKPVVNTTYTAIELLHRDHLYDATNG